MTTDFDLCAAAPTASSAMEVEPASSPTVSRHPSAALFDTAAAEVMGVVRSYADFKNVAVREEEVEFMAQFFLEGFSRKELSHLVACEAGAIETLRASVDFMLDVLATAGMMRALHASTGSQPIDERVLLPRAEAAVRDMNREAANTGRGMRIWPELDKIIPAICKRGREIHSDAVVEFVRLPSNARMRSAVNLSARPMTDAIKAATPNREGWFDDR